MDIHMHILTCIYRYMHALICDHRITNKVSMYIHTYTYSCVDILTHTHLHMDVQKYIFKHIHKFVHMYAYMYSFKCANVCMCNYMDTYRYSVLLTPIVIHT